MHLLIRTSSIHVDATGMRIYNGDYDIGVCVCACVRACVRACALTWKVQREKRKAEKHQAQRNDSRDGKNRMYSETANTSLCPRKRNR